MLLITHILYFTAKALLMKEVEYKQEPQPWVISTFQFETFSNSLTEQQTGPTPFL